MKRTIRYIGWLTVLLAFLVLSGCASLTVDDVMGVIAPSETPIPGSDVVFTDVSVPEIEPLSLVCQEMDGIFSPFWAEKDGDRMVAGLTQLSLSSDPGDPSPSEIVRTENEDGSTVITISLKDGLAFSDGEPITADDLLFTYYVLMDSDYDGPVRVNTLPVRGLAAYWNGMDLDMYTKYIMMYDQIYNNGDYDKDLLSQLDAARKEARDRGIAEANLEKEPAVKKAQEALDAYDSVRAEEIREAIEDAWRQDADALVEYTMENYSGSIELRTSYSRDEVLSHPGLRVMYTMLDRGFGSLNEDGGFTATNDLTWDLKTGFPTEDDLFSVMYETYGGDAAHYWSIEGVGRPDMLASVENALVRRWAPEDEFWRGTVDRIEGLEKLDDRTVAVTLEYCDDTVQRILTDVFVAPLHVYGDRDLFDPAQDSFGFLRSDLRSVRALNRTTIGGGEFVYDRTEIRTVLLTPNDHYWLGRTEIPSASVTDY